MSIAAAVGVNRHTVTLWRKRFAEQGLQCLWQIAPGRGRKPVYGTERIKAVVDATLQTKPKGQSHWSCRLMAQRQLERWLAAHGTPQQVALRCRIVLAATQH